MGDGQLFAGQYEIVREVGTGGYARVYEARQVGLGRLVALKILDLQKMATHGGVSVQTSAARFEREARAMASLRSSHTVTVHDYGISQNGAPYIALEYVRGESLEALIQREGPQPQERVREMLKCALESLSEAHANGMLHRDIKPGNIMMSRDERGREVFKVLDFGIVKIMSPSQERSDLTSEEQLVGTPRYMAPEQVLNPLDVTAAADLYSLGLVAYEMLTGRPGVEGHGAMDLATKQATGDSVRLHEAHGIEPGLMRVVNAMMEKDVSRRFATADHALESLSMGGQGLPMAAPVQPAQEKTTDVVVHVERGTPWLASTTFRASVGAYMTIGSLVWMAMVKPGSAIAQTLGPDWISQAVGQVTLGFGVVCLIPLFWAWKKGPVRGVRKAFMALWGLFALVMGAAGAGALWWAVMEAKAGFMLTSAMGATVAMAYGAGAVALATPIWVKTRGSLQLEGGVDPTNVIMRIAREQGGRVSAIEVAAQSELHYKEAGKILKRLANEGHCEEKVGLNGKVFFEFDAFVGGGNKIDVFDDDVVLGLTNDSIDLQSRFHEIEESEAKY